MKESTFTYVFFTTLVLLIPFTGCLSGEGDTKRGTTQTQEKTPKVSEGKEAKEDTSNVDVGRVDSNKAKKKQSTDDSKKGVKLWRQARTGMKTQDILSAFNGEAVALEDPVEYSLKGDDALATATIKEVNIGDVAYKVHFIVDPKQHRLIRVALKPSSDETEIQRNAFDELKTLLTERYGEPTIEESSSASKLLAWTEDERTIELKFTEMESFASTYVWYKSNSREGMNML
jgi:hypothetical protein